MEFKGCAHRYGRDIDTDVIIPARYLNTSDPAELAKHCLEDLDVNFVGNVKPGDRVVAEETFGCGGGGVQGAGCADTGTIVDETTGQTFKAQPFPPFIREIIEAGGLINRTKEKLGRS